MAGPRKPQAPADPRRAALAALDAIESRQAPLETAITDAPGFAVLAARDRAFARNLVSTCLRHNGEIEAVMAALIARPLPASARAARHILKLGLTQLLFLATPPHAAVATSVNLAGQGPALRFKGLINAVLRRASREGAELLGKLDAPRLNTPEPLWQSWEATYGAEGARAIATANMVLPPLDLTPRKGEDIAALASLIGAEPLPTGSLRCRDGGLVAEMPGFDEGRWWVQDAAAALPARLLGDVAGRRVLDLCAAPGGKTLQLADAGAKVTAADQDKARLEIVRRNLARLRLDAALICADGRSYDAPPFDAVLLDAPCSATGTIRRHPDIALGKGPADAARLAPLQAALLDNAARLTRPGGTLVYAVCSLQPEEGEERIAAFLGRHPDFSRVPVSADEIGGLAQAITVAGDLRTLPSFLGAEGGMDGFYAARLRRSGEAAT
jgi:16S rRNA (cytosine967-C5)-methyltransferase